MSVNLFSQDFIRHLANILRCDYSTIENAITSFDETCKANKSLPLSPVKSIRKCALKKSSDPIDSTGLGKDDEKHICSRLPRGKIAACGKNAKNRINEDDGTVNWYCGTENSGCYKSILLAQKKQTKLASSKPKGMPPAKKARRKYLATNARRKIDSDIKSRSLIHKIIKRQRLDISKIKVGDEILYIDHQSRVLFNRETEEAYGVLSKNNKTIESLSDENIRWLETSSIMINFKSKNKKTALKEKLFKKTTNIVDDEEELRKLRDNVKKADTGDSDDDINLEDSDTYKNDSDEDFSSDGDIDLGSDEE